MSKEEGNPYSRMVALMRGEGAEHSGSGESKKAGMGAASVKMRLGSVVTCVPLTVNVAGIVMPTSCLKINERLTKGATWKERIVSESAQYGSLSGNLSGPVSCAGDGCSPQLGPVTGGTLNSADTRIDAAEVTQLEIDLEVGDRLLLLTEDDQIFYIVMKVVDAV